MKLILSVIAAGAVVATTPAFAALHNGSRTSAGALRNASRRDLLSRKRNSISPTVLPTGRPERPPAQGQKELQPQQILIAIASRRASYV